MPEENVVNGYWLNPQESSSEVIHTPVDGTLQPEIESKPVTETSESGNATEQALHRQAWKQERQTLFQELELAHRNNFQLKLSLEENPVEGIYRLEPGEEQLTSGTFNEFNSEQRSLQRLETQLATTEEVASLQQQALVRLKQLLAGQQQALEDQINQVQTKDQTLQELLSAIETLVQAQQFEIGNLKTQLSQERTKNQSNQKQTSRQLSEQQTELAAEQQRVRELEAQILSASTKAGHLEVQLVTAHQQIESLYRVLGDRAYSLKQLTATHRHSENLVLEQKTNIAARDSQIEALENKLAHQVNTHAQLQQAYQQLEDERDYHQARTNKLERQRAALQEQILMQAQQANEYEAAIKSWKDLCESNHRLSQQLKQLLERSLPEGSADIEQLLRTLPSSTDASTRTPIIRKSPHSTSYKAAHVDLPGFLRKLN